jgi:hypothetical protein
MCCLRGRHRLLLPPSFRMKVRSHKRIDSFSYAHTYSRHLSQSRTLQGTRRVKMSQVQQYWLPGYGLSRQIVLGQIQYFLGPTATVRPYTYQVKLRLNLRIHSCAPYNMETHGLATYTYETKGARRLLDCWRTSDKSMSLFSFSKEVRGIRILIACSGTNQRPRHHVARI